MSESQLEIDVSEWLIHHADGLLKDLESRHNSSYELFPDQLYYIYLESYEREVLSTIERAVLDSFNVNREEISFMTKDFIVNLLGHKILEPKKDN